MNNNYKKIINLIYFFIACFFLLSYSNAAASNIILKSSSDKVGIGEQFYVDVLLDTKGKVINGFEGSIVVPIDNLSFIRSEEGGSMISLWVEKPKLNQKTINFSGIIPNGFGGVINPFSPKDKLPGLMIRLVFEAKKDGVVSFLSSGSYATLNDGLGTTLSIPDSSISVIIDKSSNPFIYKTQDDIEPELSAFVTRNPNLFNNKYALIFDAKDSKTGIKEVLIKEGRRKWKSIESPYLLEDQSRHSIIMLQATNYSGSSIAMNIEGVPYTIFSLKNILVSIPLFVLLLFILKKIYEKIK